MAYQYKNYEESDAVKQYRQQLEQLQQQQPGDYQSAWQAAQQKAANDVMNRQNFQYNMSSDPLYQQYKQQYQRQGKLAMQDTMGQAAAMNGGYGSSYAQMAGQQAYNSQLQQLNDRVPELYQLALSKYQMEGQAAMDRFNLASSLESQDYSRYQDQLANWQAERDYATGRYDTERNADYNLWSDTDQREYSRYQDQQTIAMAQVDYLLSIGVEPNAELLAMAGYDSQYVSEMIKKATAPVYSGGTKDKSGDVSLVSESQKIAQVAGTGAAIKYIEDQTGSTTAGQLGAGKNPEAIKAMDQVKGMAMTEYYKKMMAAQNANK